MKVKTLDQRHPSLDQGRLGRLWALYEGGERWERLLDTWFPKLAAESDEVWIERKANARYVNHAGSVVSMLAAALFAEAPQIEGLEGDYWGRLWLDCDGQGSAWARWWQARLEDAQVGRHAFIWVNLPARPADILVDNRADEERQKLLDAYLVPLTAEQVIDWGEDARGQLTWILAKDSTSERNGPDEIRRTTTRWTYIDATRIRRWTWTATEQKPTPDPDDEVTEASPIEHRIGRLPVVRLQLPPGLWTMGKVEGPAVLALRARNDLSWALHQAANELLVLTTKWEDNKPVLGHGRYLTLQRDKDGEDTAAYVGPSGVAFEHLAADVGATREEVYRAVQQMALSSDASSAKARLSGESKAEDWRALDIVLAAYQDLVLQAMRQVLGVILAARGEGAEPSVSGLDGWQSEDLAGWLEACSLATDAAEMSFKFRQLVAKRQAQRVLQDEVDAKDLEEVYQEIDEAEPPPAPFVPPPSIGQRPGAPGGPQDDSAAQG